MSSPRSTRFGRWRSRDSPERTRSPAESAARVTSDNDHVSPSSFSTSRAPNGHEANSVQEPSNQDGNKRDFSHLSVDQVAASAPRFTPVNWSDDEITEDDCNSLLRSTTPLAAANGSRSQSRLDTINDEEEIGVFSRSNSSLSLRPDSPGSLSSQTPLPSTTPLLLDFELFAGHTPEQPSTVGDSGFGRVSTNVSDHLEIETKVARKTSVQERILRSRLLKRRVKQISIVAIVTVGILVALQSGPLAFLQLWPTPVKFFSQTSLITDYEFGEVSKLSISAKDSDVTFVMYYDPEDIECARFKQEYETVAKHYNQQIFFAAINCWWPDGECSKAVKLKKYPLFVAHVRNGHEVEYRGPLVASYIIPFLDNLLDPVIPINSDVDLLELRSKHDAVVVGYFDFQESQQPQGYKSYMKAALRSLAVDPWRRVQFAIVTARKVAYKLKIDRYSPSLFLFRWNGTYEFSGHMGKFPKSERIVSWTFETVHETGSLVDWVTPNGVKRNALDVIGISRTPATFVLFTPRSLVLGISPYVDVLREVAMDYFDCDKSQTIRSLIYRSILRRRVMEERLMELEEKCHEKLQSPEAGTSSSTTQPFDGDTCCHAQSIKWRPISKSAEKRCFCTGCVQVSLAKCPGGCKRFNCLATASRYLSTFEPSSVVNSSAAFCNQIKASYQPKYTPYYKISVSCSGLSPEGVDYENEVRLSGKTEPAEHFVVGSIFGGLSGFGGDNQRDEKIERMVASFENQYCSRLNLGLSMSDLNFPDSGEGVSMSQSWRNSFTGLGCTTTDKSLSFIAVDSILFPAIAEELGLEVFNETHSTLAIIVEPANPKNIYLLNHDTAVRSLGVESGTISKRSIYQFIKNYTAGSVPRFVKSALTTSSSEQCLTESDGTHLVCVPEVTSESFKSIVLNPKKDVVLFYYTPWCVSCTNIAHIYLSVARFFLGIDGLVFARINPDKYELPFEYTVERYPTILFYSAQRKLESVPYPESSGITPTNLVKFVLENATPQVRWQASFQMCDRKCLSRNYVSYSKYATRLYRRINGERKFIAELSVRHVWPQKFKNKQQKSHISNLVKNLKKALVENRQRSRSLVKLLQILRARFVQYDESFSLDLSRELLLEMGFLMDTNELHEKVSSQGDGLQTQAPKVKAINVNKVNALLAADLKKNSPSKKEKSGSST